MSSLDTKCPYVLNFMDQYFPKALMLFRSAWQNLITQIADRSKEILYFLKMPSIYNHLLLVLLLIMVSWSLILISFSFSFSGVS